MLPFLKCKKKTVKHEQDEANSDKLDLEKVLTKNRIKNLLYEVRISEIIFESLPQLLLQLCLIDLDIFKSFLKELMNLNFENLTKNLVTTCQSFSIIMSLVSINYFFTKYAFVNAIFFHRIIQNMTQKKFTKIHFFMMLRFCSNFLLLTSRLVPLVFFIRKSLWGVLLIFIHLLAHAFYLFKTEPLIESFSHVRLGMPENMSTLSKILLSLILASLKMFTFYDFIFRKKMRKYFYYFLLLFENLFVSLVTLYYLDNRFDFIFMSFSSEDDNFTFKIYLITLAEYVTAILIEALNQYCYDGSIKTHARQAHLDLKIDYRNNHINFIIVE